MMPTADWALESHQWKNILKAYLACISFTDHQVGIVLDALEKSPNAGKTIVILWSDHGYRLGEKNVFAKVCFWDRATRVPLLFAGPGIPANKKSDIQVELLSVYPTLTDLAGLPHNLSNEGHSLLPLIRQEKVKWEHPAISTWGRNNHAVKTQNFRYIHYEDGSEELYDILKDPNEWYNLAGEKKYGKTKSSLQKLLPKVNVHWAEASYYNANEYIESKRKGIGNLIFMNQKFPGDNSYEKGVFLFGLFLMLQSWVVAQQAGTIYPHTIVFVSSNEEIYKAVEGVVPGDTLFLRDGIYRDIQLIVKRSGSAGAPVLLRAENPGKVFFTGNAKVELRGDYLILEGIYFKDGNRNTVEWQSHGPGLVAIYGSHNRVTQCTFDAFDEANSAYITTSLNEDGRVPQHCRIDHCGFFNKITFDQVINQQQFAANEERPRGHQ